MARINWTLQAIEDLDAIAEFISHNSPRYASEMVAKSFEAIELLKQHPRLGRIVPEYQEKSIRELILKKRVRIIYRILSEDRIDILTVHAASRPLPGTSDRL